MDIIREKIEELIKDKIQGIDWSDTPFNFIISKSINTCPMGLTKLFIYLTVRRKYDNNQQLIKEYIFTIPKKRINKKYLFGFIKTFEFELEPETQETIDNIMNDFFIDEIRDQKLSKILGV